jgi:membrane protease YdiL (CAAX protease family)
MAPRLSMGPVQDGAPSAEALTAPQDTPVSQDTPESLVAATSEDTSPAAAEFDIMDPEVVLPIAGYAVLLGLVLAPLAQRVARWTFPRASLSTGPSFSWRDIASVAFVFVALQLFMVGLVAALEFDMDSLSVALSLTVLMQAGTGLFILGLAARRRHGFAALGLRRGENTWALGYGLTRYVGCGPFLYALLLLTPLLLERVFGVPHEPQDVVRMIAGAEGLERLLAPLLAVLLIPLLEELLFRGFLQNALEPHIGAWPALVLSSLAFAALHGTSALIPIFGLSLILGVIMLRTRRLSACWFVHALHNGLTTGILFLAPETLLEQAR